MANEKRLIDADALYEEIERVYVDHYEKSAYKFIHDFFNAMRRRIRRATTVDAVEVVRCNNCRHEDGGYCNHFGYYSYAPMVTEDDFCSHGERREGE